MKMIDVQSLMHIVLHTYDHVIFEFFFFFSSPLKLSCLHLLHFCIYYIFCNFFRFIFLKLENIHSGKMDITKAFFKQ